MGGLCIAWTCNLQLLVTARTVEFDPDYVSVSISRYMHGREGEGFMHAMYHTA